ncbi:MAG TPA: hypothetical protein VFB54_11055 [Burkholderiales bacterium]|nr:hypothetical protein [Burkholderiales bacterium]
MPIELHALVGGALGSLIIAAVAAYAPMARCGDAQSALEAQFRGCDLSGGCRFQVERGDPSPPVIYRVVPDGVTHPLHDHATSRAVRDRLNALLASMIHQHKRIDLRGLRVREDGTYAARVTVNGVDVACDPILAALQRSDSDGCR